MIASGRRVARGDDRSEGDCDSALRSPCTHAGGEGCRSALLAPITMLVHEARPICHPGLEGHLVATFVSTASAAEADDKDGILLMRARGHARARMGLGMAGPKNKVAELANLFIVISSNLILRLLETYLSR